MVLTAVVLLDNMVGTLIIAYVCAIMVYTYVLVWLALLMIVIDWDYVFMYILTDIIRVYVAKLLSTMYYVALKISASLVEVC